MLQKTYIRFFILLSLLLVVLVCVNISLGSVDIPTLEVFDSIVGSSSKSSWQYIITNYRIPKAITAIIAGGGLAISGLLMQTLFRNPLAGPFVLGLSSGASLGVAILILGAGAISGIFGAFLLGPWSLVIGLMFGSLTGALVAVLSYFSDAEQLQQYIFWSFGSLGNQTWQGISILSLCFFVGLLLSIYSAKSLNALLLGENYAKSMGLKIKKNMLLLILATSILAGGITAFVGPIAFIGLAVPHLTRQFIKTSNHFVLIPAVALSGAILMLVCDTIAQLPGTVYTLPINAITSLIGAPVVIWLLVRKRKLIF